MIFKKRTTVIEFTDTYLKLAVMVQYREGRGVVSQGAVPLTGSSPNDIVQSLRDMDKRRFPPRGRLTVLIPRSRVTFRYLRLPAVKDQEIRGMVDLQVGEHTPYDRKDIVFDFSVLCREEDGYSRVLLVIVPRKTVEEYLHLLALAGLYPDILTIQAEAFLSYVSLSGNSGDNSSSEVAVLVNTDNRNLEITPYHPDGFWLSRTIDCLTEDGEKNLVALSDQVQETVETFTEEFALDRCRNIRLIPLSSRAARLTERLPAHVSSPGITLDPVPTSGLGLSEETLSEIMELSYAAILSAAVFPGKLHFNLLPQNVRRLRDVKKRKRHWGQIAVWLMLLFIFSAVSRSVHAARLSRYLEDLRAESKAAGISLQRTDRLTRQVDLVEKVIAPRVPVMEILYRIHRETPPEIAFDLIEIRDAGQLILEGVGRSQADINAFCQRLIRSQYFHNVALQYARQRRTRGGELTLFRINAETSSLQERRKD